MCVMGVELVLEVPALDIQSHGTLRNLVFFSVWKFKDESPKFFRQLPTMISAHTCHSHKLLPQVPGSFFILNHVHREKWAVLS